jgi:hypothetical protein
MGVRLEQSGSGIKSSGGGSGPVLEFAWPPAKISERAEIRENAEG